MIDKETLLAFAEGDPQGFVRWMRRNAALFGGAARNRYMASKEDIALFWSAAFCVELLPDAVCWVCGRVCDGNDHIHRAHIYPHHGLASGAAWNLALTCEQCNDDVELSGEYDAFRAYSLVRRLPVVHGFIGKARAYGLQPDSLSKHDVLYTIMAVALRKACLEAAQSRYFHQLVMTCSVSKRVLKELYDDMDAMMDIDEWCGMVMKAMSVSAFEYRRLLIKIQAVVADPITRSEWMGKRFSAMFGQLVPSNACELLLRLAESGDEAWMLSPHNARKSLEEVIGMLDRADIQSAHDWFGRLEGQTSWTV